MSQHTEKWIASIALVWVMLLIAACGQATPTPAATSAPPTAVPATAVAQQPTPTPGPTAEPVPEEAALQVPYAEQWAGSGHADGEAVAFTNWNDDDPAEVPVECARCHSAPGYQDYLGADGTEAGVVDHPAAIGSTVNCVTCHNDVTLTLDKVTFPSGAEISGLRDEARCMVCHQGRASKLTVDASIEKAGVTDPDTPSEDLGFTNIHYYAAAATQYGTLAMGGYQYPDKAYDARSAHVDGYDTCIGCHDSHTLEVKVQDCATCHEGVESTEDLKNIRMAGSLVDYDGDANVEEGVYDEIEGLRSTLYTAMQTYAKDVAGKALIYDSSAYPYFFIDTNENGTSDEGEAIRDNRYNAWTARLAKAAYNYQTSLKDPGAYAHGGKYIIELLYDSIEDLNGKLDEPIDMSGMHRIDAGHFAGSEFAFRDWDEAGKVPGTCAKCHTPGGLPQFLAEATTVSAPIANGLQCETCHASLTDFTRITVEKVRFPSGATIDSGNPDANLCLNCHQGRESTTSVNNAIRNLELDTPNETLSFRNVHYFAAGATLFGTEAKGAYEFADKQYNGRFEHREKFNDCIECHDTHALEVKVEECADCHDGVTTVETLREIRDEDSTADYDGDGNVEEGIAGEIETMQEKLYAAIVAYSTEVGGSTIVYNSHSHPYFFIDTDGDGTASEEESIRDNRYLSWTPRLLQAAYNYQFSQKDPGAFTHNGKYILQVLYDSLETLSTQTTVDMTGLVRPEVEVPATPTP